MTLSLKVTECEGFGTLAGGGEGEEEKPLDVGGGTPEVDGDCGEGRLESPEWSGGAAVGVGAVVRPGEPRGGVGARRGGGWTTSPVRGRGGGARPGRGGPMAGPGGGGGVAARWRGGLVARAAGSMGLGNVRSGGGGVEGVPCPSTPKTASLGESSPVKTGAATSSVLGRVGPQGGRVDRGPDLSTLKPSSVPRLDDGSEEGGAP